MMSIGDRIRQVREEKTPRLTQTALARAVGMTVDKLNKVEMGTRSVSGTELTALANALDLRPEQLLRDPVAVHYRGNPSDPGVESDLAIFNRFIDNWHKAEALVWISER